MCARSPPPPRVSRNGTEAQKQAAATFIEINEIYEADWWVYLLALIGLICAFRFVALIALARRALNFF